MCVTIREPDFLCLWFDDQFLFCSHMTVVDRELNNYAANSLSSFLISPVFSCITVKPKTVSPPVVQCDRHVSLSASHPEVRLHSPGYPHSLYPDHTNCTVFLHAPPSAILEVEFWDFQLENHSASGRWAFFGQYLAFANVWTGFPLYSCNQLLTYRCKHLTFFSFWIQW